MNRESNRLLKKSPLKTLVVFSFARISTNFRTERGAPNRLDRDVHLHIPGRAIDPPIGAVLSPGFLMDVGDAVNP
jgi:hypothetical protein